MYVCFFDDMLNDSNKASIKTINNTQLLTTATPCATYQRLTAVASCKELSQLRIKYCTNKNIFIY